MNKYVAIAWFTDKPTQVKACKTQEEAAQYLAAIKDPCIKELTITECVWSFQF